MRDLREVAVGLLLCVAAACSKAGDFESNCALACALPDGGTLQRQVRVACCGEHDNPSHANEEGSACSVDWVNSHAQQLCQARAIDQTSPNGGLATIVCPADQFQCSCTAPAAYPSYEGCD
jgi:hypothetical protein